MTNWSGESERNCTLIAEPLGPEHDRASFSCESEPLERYLKQQANQGIRKDLSVAYVLVPLGDRHRIAGHYTLCSDTILIDDLPAELVRKPPFLITGQFPQR